MDLNFISLAAPVSSGSGVRAGLLGWSAYTGAAAAGLPLGWLIQSSGWQAWETGNLDVGIP